MQIRKILIGSFAFMVTVTLAAAAEAPIANLSDANGKILVDQGQGFVASAGQDLKAGDRVFIGDKSSAVVAYAACTVKLDKPTVFVVSKAAPCLQGSNSTQIGSVIISPAYDPGAGSGGILGSGGTGPIVLVGSLLAIGAGVYVVVNKPASNP